MTSTDHARLTHPTTLEIVRTLPGPIERVWQYLTVSDLRAKWFCGGELEPRDGGDIVFDFDHRRISDSPPPEKHKDQQVVRFVGKIDTYDPPHRLSFIWPEEDGEGTHVTITLSEVNDEVQLHLIHTRLHKADYRQGAAAGWHAHLDLLADLLSGGTARDFWIHYTTLEREYAQMFGQ